MNTIRSRLNKLERARQHNWTDLTHLSDEELKRRLWKHILPLSGKLGIENVSDDFPGEAVFDRILDDHYAAIRDEFDERS